MFGPRDFFVSICCVVVLTVQSSHGSEIINGEEVDPHSLPYMALLRNESNAPVCGGILIGPKWVLTAAHCLNIKDVLLGMHSIQKEDKGTRRVRVVQSFNHPLYESKKNSNDLKLLKLKESVKKTETVGFFRLGNTVQDPAPGTKCLVAGWGTTKNNVQIMSKVLMSVNVTVIDRVMCNSPEYYNFDPVITRDMVCAGTVGKNVADTCQGDSGGPLVCNGVLVGVTSFGGKRCGLAKKPGVYTFLSEVQLFWINSTIKKKI